MRISKQLLAHLMVITIFTLCLGCGHEHGPDTHTHDSDAPGHTHAPGERGDGHSHYNNQEDRPP